jgi:hypothetical protein
MKNSWTQTFRRLAAASVVAGTTAFSSAMCYAQIAFDTASDPVYNNGWQAGDNGGSGWGAWNFDGTYNTAPPNQQAIDNGLKAGGTGSAPFNDIGQSWTLFNPLGPIPGPEPPPDQGTDISQAGRAIPGNLQIGQTVRVVVDNPTQRNFFRGYTVRFNQGGGNTVYAGVPQSRLAVGTFEYFTNGQWFATGTGGNPTLTDMDTDSGMQIDFTLTGTNTFALKMTPLDNPGSAFSKTGTLDGTAGAPIDWVEFELYNTDSNFYPTAIVGAAPQATDFYIRSMMIVIPEPATVSLIFVGTVGALLASARSRKRE